MIYAAQLRAARALLGWRQEDLAKAADVGLATLQRIESSEGVVNGNAKTIWKLQAALETGGIEFVTGPSKIGVLAKRAQ